MKKALVVSLTVLIVTFLLTWGMFLEAAGEILSFNLDIITSSPVEESQGEQQGEDPDVEGLKTAEKGTLTFEGAYKRKSTGMIYGTKPELNVAFPDKEEQIWASPIFVFGSTDPGEEVQVTVNGELVDEFDPRTGNFLTMVDVSRGSELDLAVKASNPVGCTEKNLSVAFPDAWTEMDHTPLAIHSHHFLPRKDQVLSEGETLMVAVQGSPGAEASFKLGDQDEWVAMEEMPPEEGLYYGRGIYKGTYRVSAEAIPSTGRTDFKDISVMLSHKRTDGERETTIKEAPGQVAFSASDYGGIVELKPHWQASTGGWLRSTSEGGHDFNITSHTRTGTGYRATAVEYLPEGTWFEPVGKSGEYLRFKLQPGKTHLIHQDAVDKVDVETLSKVDRAGQNARELSTVLAGVAVEETREKVRLKFDTGMRVPLFREDGLEELSFTLIGGKVQHIENREAREEKGTVDIAKEELPIEGESSVIREMEVKEIHFDGSDMDYAFKNQLQVTISLEEKLSSFDFRWEDNGLVLEIFRRSDVNREAPLAGKTLVIDPGHGGDDKGARGPDDVHEKHVAMDVSAKLQDKFEAEGARVIMTRETDELVPLYRRTDPALEHDADLFISVHANAHAQGNDAVSTHGHMTLFKFAHNESLAEIMLDALEEEMGLPRLWTWERNIAVLRSPRVSSVLVELAYMKHPEDNYYLLSDRGQARFAEAIKKGAEAYFLETAANQ